VKYLVVAAVLCAATAARADEVDELIAQGDVRAAAGDADGALVRYEKALAIDPDRLAVYDRAIPLWVAGEEWADAMTWLEKATLRDPHYAAGWYALGYVYRRTGRIAAAVLAYAEFVALRPDDSAGRFGLAVSHELADDGAAAIRAYRRYLALEQDPARAAYRAEARAAIERLTPAPASWTDALREIATGRATMAAWRYFSGSPSP
jgi:predicted Zn-dependent protease